jgi:heme O synthase-like polyprenyltransferase
MITKEINIEPLQMKARIGSYVQLLKLRLTLLVVFSAAITLPMLQNGN